MLGLMMDMPLLISGLIQYAADYHGEAQIVAREIEGDIHRYTYAEAHPRIKRMALALKRLGMKPGDRVGTLAWNTHRHFEMFYAAPGMGYVLHTVNPRLFPEQLVYIINHAEDRILFVDRATLPIVEAIAPQLTTVEAYGSCRRTNACRKRSLRTCIATRSSWTRRATLASPGRSSTRNPPPPSATRRARRGIPKA
ncbi:acyl-CoA synthetase (AMP-forming)/AMP-acid ligase II [Bradyrhizobium sp. GM24.11]